MRVLHIASGRLYGGLERTLVVMAEAGAAGMAAGFGLCHAGRLSRELERAGADCLWLGEVRLRYPWRVAGARRRLRRRLQAGEFDAVVCHGFWTACVFAPAIRAAGMPVVIWSHEMAWGVGAFERWTARSKPALVLACSEFSAATMGLIWRGAAAPEVVVQRTPVAPLPAAASARARLRRRWNTPADAIVILQAGRMEWCKGHDLHLRALAALREVPGWVAWFAGGPQRQSERNYLHGLQAQAEQLGIEGRIRWLGEQTNIAEVYAAADLLCQPNQSPDVFALTFIEAMYAGLPVLTTALGGAPEAIGDDCGSLVAPEAAAVAACLRRWIADPEERRRRAAGGPRRARELCDPAARMRELAARLQPLARTSAAWSAAAPIEAPL